MLISPETVYESIQDLQLTSGSLEDDQMTGNLQSIHPTSQPSCSSYNYEHERYTNTQIPQRNNNSEDYRGENCFAKNEKEYDEAGYMVPNEVLFQIHHVSSLN